MNGHILSIYIYNDFIVSKLPNHPIFLDIYGKCKHRLFYLGLIAKINSQITYNRFVLTLSFSVCVGVYVCVHVCKLHNDSKELKKVKETQEARKQTEIQMESGRKIRKCAGGVYMLLLGVRLLLGQSHRAQQRSSVQLKR